MSPVTVGVGGVGGVALGGGTAYFIKRLLFGSEAFGATRSPVPPGSTTGPKPATK